MDESIEIETECDDSFRVRGMNIAWITGERIIKEPSIAARVMMSFLSIFLIPSICS